MGVVNIFCKNDWKLKSYALSLSGASAQGVVENPCGEGGDMRFEKGEDLGAVLVKEENMHVGASVQGKAHGDMLLLAKRFDATYNFEGMGA